MEQLKTIEKKIISILKSGKDLDDLHIKFENILSGLGNNRSELKRKKIKLLNILFSYPKRKVLFEYTDFSSNSQNTKKIIIGVNKSGVGLATHYETNLRNIDDYYSKDRFFKLCEDKNFISKLVNSVKKSKRENLTKLLLIEKEENEKETFIEIGDLRIAITYRVNFEHKTKDENYGENIPIINTKYKATSLFKSEKTDFLRDIISNIFEFNFTDLAKFSWLLKRKNKIIPILKSEMKKYEITNKKISKKLEEINKKLKPYEALEQI